MVFLKDGLRAGYHGDPQIKSPRNTPYTLAVRLNTQPRHGSTSSRSSWAKSRNQTAIKIAPRASHSEAMLNRARRESSKSVHTNLLDPPHKTTTHKTNYAPNCFITVCRSVHQQRAWINNRTKISVHRRGHTKQNKRLKMCV